MLFIDDALGAFTLIELLVVIAIVATLAAFLLTALSLAKDQAYSTYCKNNLTQQGLAMQMYVGDTGFYPYYQGAVNPAWEITLQAYYPAPDIMPAYNDSDYVAQQPPPTVAFQCPAYVRIVTRPGGSTLKGDSWQDNWSYGYNIWGSTQGSADVPNLDYCLGLGMDAPWLWEFIVDGPHSYLPGTGNQDTSINLPARRETEVAAPSELFALMDSRGVEENSELNTWTGFDWTDATQGWSLAPRPQHGKIFNVLFGDWHVAEVRISTLSNPAVSARHWNVDNEPHPETWGPWTVIR